MSILRNAHVAVSNLGVKGYLRRESRCHITRVLQLSHPMLITALKHACVYLEDQGMMFIRLTSPEILNWSTLLYSANISAFGV